jgi:hypothetical protein
MRTVRIAAAAALVAVLCSLAQATPSGAATTSARSLAAALAVRAESGSSTYQRTAFRHWVDANHDCQDTRAEVLISESRSTVHYTTTRHCKVATGRWVSPYDGATWTRASDVDIDHVVALKEAWESGARSWTSTNRERYANDLGHPWTLEAVTDNVNASKADRDFAQWRPSAGWPQCSYALKVATVKYRWRLAVDPAERTALLRILSGSCGAQRVTIPARAL